MRSRDAGEIKVEIRDLVQRAQDRVRQMAQLNQDMELALRAMAYLLHEKYGEDRISEFVAVYIRSNSEYTRALERLEADPRYAFLLESDRT